MIAVDNELIRKIGADKAILYTYLSLWTQFERPLPGPVKAWADHLPFAPGRTEELVAQMIEQGLISDSKDGYLPASVTGWAAPKKRKRAVSGKSDAFIHELVCFFSEQTGIPMPEPPHTMSWATYNKLWRTPVSQMLHTQGGDVDETRRIMKLAVDDMRKGRLTISTPLSIRRTYDALCATKPQKVSVW